MPALPLVPDVILAKLLWTDDTDASVSSNVFFRYSGSPPNAAACVALAEDIANAMNPSNVNWHNDTILTGCKVTDLSSASGGVGEYTQSELGALESAPLAGGTALVVGYEITRRYRGGKPRNYFPWGSSASLNGRQAWSPAFIESCTGTLTTFFGDAIGSTSGGTTITDHVNVSYYAGFHVITTPSGRMKNVSNVRTTPIVDTIVSWGPSARPGSQRRRN